MDKLRTGTKVEWRWGPHKARGKVSRRFTSEISRKIEGTTVKRNASADEPAYLIRQADGGEVLKSRSELRKTD